jgi:hypothetical protein
MNVKLPVLNRTSLMQNWKGETRIQGKIMSLNISWVSVHMILFHTLHVHVIDGSS